MSVDEKWIVGNSSRSIGSGIIELWGSRAVLFALVKRDLKSRYRTSFFGFAWAFTKPLLQLGVYVLVIGSILGASRSISNFAIFIFAGLMFWNFFAESVIVGSNSIVAGSGLVTKVAFPREILPLASVLIALVNLTIQFPVLIFGYLFTGSHPDFGKWIYVVPVLLTLFFISTALSLLLSAANVYARDIQPLTEIMTMLLMYLSPVIYSWTFVHDAILNKYGNLDMFRIYELNPMTHVLSGIQDFFWNGNRYFSSGENAPDYLGATLSQLWLIAFLALTFLSVSYSIFLRLEPNFAREL